MLAIVAVSLGTAAALGWALAAIGWQRAAAAQREEERRAAIRRARERYFVAVVPPPPVPRGDTLISGRSP